MVEHEARVYSQNGEDGVIAEIFRRIGIRDRIAVEIGVGDRALECNTRLLRQQGWETVQFDAAGPYPRVWQEHVTAENINPILADCAIPDVFDLLSIDIDGNDLWVWRALTKSPRVVVIEYNAGLGPDERLVIPYDPDFAWTGTSFYGASLQALVAVGAQKGYTLVHCESNGINAFFVRDADLTWEPPPDIYRPWPAGFTWPPDPRHFVQLEDAVQFSWLVSP